MQDIPEEIIEGLQKIIVEFLCKEDILFKYITILHTKRHTGIEEASVDAVIKYAMERSRTLKGVCINFFQWGFKWKDTEDGDEYWGKVDNRFFGFLIHTEFYNTKIDV